MIASSKWLAVAVAAALLSAVGGVRTAAAQNGCEPALISALKTTYTNKTFTSLDEAVRQISSSEGSNDYGIGYEGFELSSKSKKKASGDKSSSLSYRNDVNLALSFLPTAGFETVRYLCSGPGLSVSADESGGRVALTILFKGGLGLTKARIAGVTFSKDVFDCDLSPLRKNPVIKVDTPRVATCLRKTQLPGLFSVSTDVGDAFARLIAPDQKRFWLLVGGADDEITCSVNGDEVVHRGIDGGDMYFDLTPRLHHGRNALFCHPHDVNGAKGGACWNYHVELYLAKKQDAKPEEREQSYIESPGAHCGKGVPTQPDDFTIPFVWIG